LPLYAILPLPRGDLATYGLLLPATLLPLVLLARRAVAPSQDPPALALP
jgi:hypothetical protein